MLDLTATVQALILTIEAAFLPTASVSTHATVQDLETEITTLKAALMGWRRKGEKMGFMRRELRKCLPALSMA